MIEIAAGNIVIAAMLLLIAFLVGRLTAPSAQKCAEYAEIEAAEGRAQRLVEDLRAQLDAARGEMEELKKQRDHSERVADIFDTMCARHLASAKRARAARDAAEASLAAAVAAIPVAALGALGIARARISGTATVMEDIESGALAWDLVAGAWVKKP